MHATLKEELQNLLLKYPELNNSNISFVGSEVLIGEHSTIKVSDVQSLEGKSGGCKYVVQQQEVIRGHSPKVEVRRSPVHGYGVFAKQHIDQEEFIEELRLLQLGWRKHYHKDPVLMDMVWGARDCNCEECRNHGNRLYFALGLGSLYNHSDSPNGLNIASFKRGVMTIHAARPIEKDEEIFISYGDKYFLIRNWMEENKKNRKLEKYLQQKRNEKKEH